MRSWPSCARGAVDVASVREPFRSELPGRLMAGEHLVWVGWPERMDLNERGYALYAWVAGAIGVGLLLMGVAKPSWAPYRGPWIGTGGVAVAFALVFSLDWLTRARKLYVLTTRRAIIWQASVFGTSMPAEYRAEDVTELHVENESGGLGDLVLQEPRVATDVGEIYVKRGFMGVRDPRRVEALVRDRLLPSDERAAK
jgi:hypothetical protein